MEKIMILKDNTVRIRLNPKIYKKEVVEKAVSEFSKFCSVSFKDDLLEINDQDYANEFCNYLIGMMVDEK